MNKLRIGIIGTSLTALCCFTPILSLLLTMFGMVALLGYLDYILLPMLGFFLTILIYSMISNMRRPTD